MQNPMLLRRSADPQPLGTSGAAHQAQSLIDFTLHPVLSAQPPKTPAALRDNHSRGEWKAAVMGAVLRPFAQGYAKGECGGVDLLMGCAGWISNSYRRPRSSTKAG